MIMGDQPSLNHHYIITFEPWPQWWCSQLPSAGHLLDPCPSRRHPISATPLEGGLKWHPKKLEIWKKNDCCRFLPWFVSNFRESKSHLRICEVLCGIQWYSMVFTYSQSLWWDEHLWTMLFPLLTQCNSIESTQCHSAREAGSVHHQ